MAAASQLTWLCPRSSDTQRLGALLGECLRTRVATGTCIDLRGELGAGKTVFVRGLAAGLGAAPGERIVSPTFTLARDVAVPGGRLQHLDAYRLDGADAFVAAGLEECCGPGQVTCVEWGGRVADVLPADRLIVDLELEPGMWSEALGSDGPQGPRRITAFSGGPLSAALMHEWNQRARADGLCAGLESAVDA